MIAQAKQLCHCPSDAAWHGVFLDMLPTIRTHARIVFRHLDPENREEAVQDVVCNACCAVARLAELDKLNLAYPTVLARFAVAQVKDGRKVGCKLNVRDVLSPYCQQRKKISVERLDKFDREEGWQEIVVEDRNAGPADVAATRIDFGEWLRTLRRRDRRIAETLSVGKTTGEVAKRFHVSASRVSQLRSELKKSWDEFCGDVAVE